MRKSSTGEMDAGQDFVATLSWDEVERRIEAGAFAILPVAAGAKQHGLHLPMASDAIQAEALAARLAARLDGLIWPTLAYGYYPAFVAYAGSASLSAETFEAVIRELAAGLAAYRPRGVLVIDTGLSTNATARRALATIGGAVHLAAYDGPRFRACAARLETQGHGGHADELETSIMLAIDPAHVRMDRAAASPSKPPGPGPMQRHDPAAANFSASGSIGDPRGATAATGRLLLDAMVEDMLAAVDAAFG